MIRSWKVYSPLPHSKVLFVERWGGLTFPSWGMHEFPCMLPNLVHIHIYGCSRCQHLLPFSGLPHLKILQLWSFWALAYVEGGRGTTSEAYAICSEAARGVYFPSLEILKLDNMCHLKEWSRTECAEIDQQTEQLQQQYFPRLLKVEIRPCRNPRVNASMHKNSGF